jgi:Family of unknown function (DUF5681)
MNPNPSPTTRFQPGRSGNPAGRPVGSRNKTTIIAESIIGEHLPEVVTAACLRAKEGSDRAQALIISRAMAPARRRPVTVDLPETATLADIMEAHREVTRLFAAGELTSEEAKTASDLLEAHRRTIEVAELAARLDAVEARLGIAPG